jgi:hypothetical protein
MIVQSKNELPIFRGHFIVTWNNGVWKIFDMNRYCDCETFPSKLLALEALHA